MDGMYAIPPERAGCHNLYTPWWSQDGTSQGIADLDNAGMSSRYDRQLTDGLSTCEKILAIEPYVASAPSGPFTLVVRVEEPCNAILGSDGNKGHYSQTHFPLGLSQTSRMSSLISGQLKGVSSSLPAPSLVRRSRRNGTGSPSHLGDDSRRPNQRMRGRMLSDSHWFMCALEVQTMNSGTMRTASV